MKTFTGFLPSPSIVKEEQKFSNFLQSGQASQVVGSSNTIDWRHFCSPVENQYNVGSCSANAVVSNLEFLEIKQGFNYTDLSRLFVYYNARLITNTHHLDDGSNISANFEAIKKYGVCSENNYPYNVSLVNRRPSWSAYQEAFKHSITQSYRLSNSGQSRHDDILKCLKSCHPVVFGMDVYESFRETKNIINIPQSNEKLLGGHAMLIVGVDLNLKLYTIRNSWGADFGENGYCYASFDMIDKYANYEFWTATHVKKF